MLNVSSVFDVLQGEKFVVNEGAGVGGRKARLDEDDKRELSRLIVLLDEFRALKPNISVHHLTAFLRVAVADGEKSLIQHARDCGVSQSVMSRHMLDIGDEFRNGEPGLGLVEGRRSPHSRREYEMGTTPQGSRLALKFSKILQGKRD